MAKMFFTIILIFIFISKIGLCQNKVDSIHITVDTNEYIPTTLKEDTNMVYILTCRNKYGMPICNWFIGFMVRKYGDNIEYLYDNKKRVVENVLMSIPIYIIK